MLFKNNAFLRRSFSSQSALNTIDPVSGDAAPRQYKTLWEASAEHQVDEAKKVAAQADYLERLKAENNQRGVFKPLQGDSDDIPSISKIKNKINQVVEKELVLHDF